MFVEVAEAAQNLVTNVVAMVQLEQNHVQTQAVQMDM